ncbi:MauE/DoxX family redox-associated membrane protein [Allokutzneria sp. NRRL B-24872]|uniref:MauE/DoxX family redox-associated membrane protein n=1 Tax=Allokutzneria sp. NRRL B-24872 TaxID=1137961 RepID=UPI000A3ADA2E|nr:MauE/DoxX family redox-associated membrane protein [Allokutzneria sp. NRRL B-24872]
MNQVTPGCAVLLSVVFGVSAANKLGGARWRAFVASTGLLRLLPPSSRTWAAGAVVVAESAIATALAGAAVLGDPVSGIAGFAGAAALLVVFTAAIVISLRRGDRTPCHCFGASAVQLGWPHVMRNFVLLIVAGAGLTAAAAGGAAQPAVALVSGVAGGAFGLLLVRFDDLVDLFRPATRAGDGVGGSR